MPTAEAMTLAAFAMKWDGSTQTERAAGEAARPPLTYSPNSTAVKVGQKTATSSGSPSKPPPI
jgi:hypothetical protein